MVQTTEAIYADGVLKPTEPLPLREQQRVRIIIQPIDSPAEAERATAMQRLREGIRRMNFRSDGAYPTRDELHERR